MFARVKQSGSLGEYLQIVENYGDGDRVRQRMVLYIGHYDSVGDALKRMPRELRGLERRARKSEEFYQDLAVNNYSSLRAESVRRQAERERREADELAAKLEALRAIVKEHPDLVARDEKRAERHRERYESKWFSERLPDPRRSDQRTELPGDRADRSGCRASRTGVRADRI